MKQGQGRLATLRTYVQLMDDGLGGGCGDGAGGLGLKQGWMFHPAGVMLVARRGERMGLEK